jgi:HlyD family secretion protein
MKRNVPRNLPFRPGMSASADIQTNTHKNVLSVPINAVTTREKNSDVGVNQTHKGSNDAKNDDQNNDNPDTKSNSSPTDLDEVVFVLQKDNTVKKVKVKTDIQDINNIEITDGLKDSDEIITGPYGTISKILKNGTKVSVVPKDKLFEIKQ